MPWLKLTLHTDNERAEAFSNALEASGAIAVTLEDAEPARSRRAGKKPRSGSRSGSPGCSPSIRTPRPCLHRSRRRPALRRHRLIPLRPARRRGLGAALEGALPAAFGGPAALGGPELVLAPGPRGRQRHTGPGARVRHGRPSNHGALSEMAFGAGAKRLDRSRLRLRLGDTVDCGPEARRARSTPWTSIRRRPK